MIIRNDNITEASLGSSSDLNASVFLSKISAVGGRITPTIISSVDTLFKDLKANNLWDKIIAFYPLIGGTSSSCAIEGKGTSTYDLSFSYDFSSGATTFSDNGVYSNGFATSAANPPIKIGTGFTPLSFFPTKNDIHIGIYSRTTRGALANFIFGPAQIASSRLQLNINYDGSDYCAIGNVSTAQPSATSTGTTGFFMASRTSNNYIALIKNGTIVGSSTGSNEDGGLDNSNPIAILAEVASIEAAFITLGLGFTSVEASNYYNIVQTFQTSLGRAV